MVIEERFAGGALDGIVEEVKAAVTSFAVDVNERKIEHHDITPCVISCAYSEGIISFSARDMNFMLSLRLDEVMSVLQKAASAAREAEKAR